VDSLIEQKSHDIVDTFVRSPVNSDFSLAHNGFYCAIMNQKNDQEIALRRKAFKLFDKGKSMREMLQLIPRSRSWLYKWKQRFQQHGFAALKSCSKAPLHSPQRYPPPRRALVLNLRKRLRRATAGLSGARAIRRELKHHHRRKRIPALSTINRWLKEAELPQHGSASQRRAFLSSSATAGRVGLSSL
jgi:transposase